MDKKRILLVEDDQYTRELYEEVIKGEGYMLDSATNGEEGLEKIKNGGYNLILLDVMMPKMSGLEVLRAVKNDPPKVQNGPIVILTNLTNDPILNQAYGLNARDFVVKSDITPGDLLEKIKGYLAEPKSK
ncbi:MAG: Two-component chemotaxis response transcriptional regulator cheY [Candidatus Curtissbacteria bacterium GW2011_GWA1_41_11]|uniref:Two-component chemotaxis response transcriptional regulator cheY n=1 Tax=Candidatus Curtissbacteria bacterium GW2011_GWA1_41_11 TaxID=1618409 RepID=A0A0G0WUG8_9BACT|nr:MAG: Two-component chemotaxis response transcriptional regulator cheY [Candidatus Curtissbacteria bacterium GW2011_GWA1_41_11]